MQPRPAKLAESEEFMNRKMNEAIHDANALGKYKCFYFFPNVIFIFCFIM